MMERKKTHVLVLQTTGTKPTYMLHHAKKRTEPRMAQRTSLQEDTQENTSQADEAKAGSNHPKKACVLAIGEKQEFALQFFL